MSRVEGLHVADVAVVGGGIMGCATAYYLALRGIDTVIVERGELNREASGTNAGSLHFQLRHYEPTSPERLELITTAVAAWRSLEDELGEDLGVRFGGGLMVADTTEEMNGLAAKLALEHSIGLQTELLSRDQLREKAPALSPLLVGASWCPEEGSVNPLLVTTAFARRACGLGARVWLGAEVIGIERAHSGGYLVRTRSGDIHAHRVVDAAGAWSGVVSQMIGVELPVSGKVVTVSVTERSTPSLRELVQRAAHELTVKQTPQGSFLIGGGWPGTYNAGTGTAGTRSESLVDNLWAAAHVLPLLRELRVLRTWPGIIAITGDGLPIIGECAKGFYALVVPSGSAGFTVGPVVGRLMADLIATGNSSISVAGYSPSRFFSSSVGDRPWE